MLLANRVVSECVCRLMPLVESDLIDENTYLRYGRHPVLQYYDGKAALALAFTPPMPLSRPRPRPRPARASPSPRPHLALTSPYSQPQHLPNTHIYTHARTHAFQPQPASSYERYCRRHCELFVKAFAIARPDGE